MDNQRLFDLVRHQRVELFTAELITKDEYAELAMAHSAVARLEDYDTTRAEAAMLREATEAILALTENQPIEEAGYLDNWVFKPSRGSAVDSAIQGLRTALSGSSGEWLERHDAEKASERIAIWDQLVKAALARAEKAEAERDNWRNTAEQESCNRDYYRSLVVQIGERFGIAAKTCDDGSKVENVLCAKVPELVMGLEAERDGLAVKFDYMAGEFQRHVDYVAQKYNEETADVRAVFGNVMVDLARIKAEARRKALLEVAEAALEKYGASPTQYWLAKMAQEADHA